MGKGRHRRRRARSGGLRVRTYPVFRRALEEGALAGARVALSDHADGMELDAERIAERVVHEVLLAIDEVFRFDDDEESR